MVGREEPGGLNFGGRDIKTELKIIRYKWIIEQIITYNYLGFNKGYWKGLDSSIWNHKNFELHTEKWASHRCENKREMLIKLNITMPSLLPAMDGNLGLKCKIFRSGSRYACQWHVSWSSGWIVITWCWIEWSYQKGTMNSSWY